MRAGQLRTLLRVHAVWSCRALNLGRRLNQSRENFRHAKRERSGAACGQFRRLRDRRDVRGKTCHDKPDRNLTMAIWTASSTHGSACGKTRCALHEGRRKSIFQRLLCLCLHEIFLTFLEKDPIARKFWA